MTDCSSGSQPSSSPSSQGWQRPQTRPSSTDRDRTRAATGAHDPRTGGHMTGWTSPTHMVALLLIALLLFGARRLPEIGRSLGMGMREFKDSVTGSTKPEE